MKNKMEKSELTRRYIIEKASPIFNKYGYAGTTMSQLTKAIDMTKGAIYGNFKDKDEIALAAFDFNVSKTIGIIKQAIEAEDNANDKLVAYANITLKNYPDLFKSGGCPVLSMAVDSDFAHPKLRKRVVKVIESMLDYVAGIIAEGIKKKEIKKTIEPQRYASIFGSLIEGGLMMSQVTGDTIYLSRNIEHIISLVNNEFRA